MHSHYKSHTIGRSRALIVALLLALAGIAMAVEPDGAFARWLGKEITIESASVDGLMPVGGKLTFVFDSEDNTVRICTRQASNQRFQWRMDLAPGCNVALAVTRGERYCTLEDVKAGNAEVLSACHRLRSRDVALRPSRVNDAVELHDVIVFPLASQGPKVSVAILIDSPARVTDGGIVVGGNK
jgi:hypothetical protein